MINPVEKLHQNLRMAFPKIPKIVFESTQEELSLSYLNKCRRYFDFVKMYPGVEVTSFPQPGKRPVPAKRSTKVS